MTRRYIPRPGDALTQARPVDHRELQSLRDNPLLIRSLVVAVLSVAVDDMERWASHYAKRTTITRNTLTDSFRAARTADEFLTTSSVASDRLTLDDCCTILDVDPDTLRDAIYKRLPAEAVNVLWRGSNPNG